MEDQSIQNPQQGEQSQPSMQPQEMDISKTTITILVMLTLIISVIGTWTVLSELNNVKVVKGSTATAKVGLTIAQPNTAPPQAVETTGKVALKIIEQN
jgi:hypothetical protein